MIIPYDPDKEMPVYHHVICYFHSQKTEEQYAGCTCEDGIGVRTATPEEGQANKCKRLSKEVVMLRESLRLAENELSQMNVNGS